MNMNNSLPEDENQEVEVPELTQDDFKRAKPGAQFLKERGIRFDPNESVEITEMQEDGTAVSYKLPPPNDRLVMLDPDVLAYFPDSETVNRTLRSLIELIPHKS